MTPINYADYHPEWHSRIRPDILRRANNCCEVCGVPNKANVWRNPADSQKWTAWTDDAANAVPAYKRAKSVRICLTVAHLDHDRDNNDYSNLKAMCQKCHNDYDRPMRLEHARETRLRKSGQIMLFDGLGVER